MTDLSSPRRRAGLARQLGLAVALASGTALLAVPGFADAAYAQKKEKKGKEAEKKVTYSDAFRAAYIPIEKAAQAPAIDFAAIKPQLVALVPVSVSPDEKNAAGRMIYTLGFKGNDLELQLQGAELAIASGILAGNDVGLFHVVASQVAGKLKQYDKAQAYLQKAIDLGYTSETVTVPGLKVDLAQLYFDQGRNTEGLNALLDAIAGRKAQGLTIHPSWYNTAVSVSWKNKIVPQAYDVLEMWVADYPTAQNWGDAINITRMLNNFEPGIMLDLFRLSDRVGALSDNNDYLTYIEAADARRRPAEVERIITEARERKVILAGEDSWVDAQYNLAKTNIAQDKTSLPGLERDASAPTAQLRTVMAAAEAMLSYGQYAKAASLFEKALTMPDADRALVLTRLGIAQLGVGDAAAARATFAKVEGPRTPVARLWSAYAAQKPADAAAAAPAAGS